jgi:hypothetical protein
MIEMELNPYTAPKAEIRSKDMAHGRPGWVWAIFILYLFSAISTVASYGLIMAGAIDLPEPQKQYLASLTASDYVLSFLTAGINLVAAIHLFRLRKISFHFFMAALLLGAVVMAWQVITNDWVSAAGGRSVAGVIFSYGLKIAICVYVWRLANTGVLK